MGPKTRVNILDPGFEYATAENIPIITKDMVREFRCSNPNFNAPEIRGAKNEKAMREDYAVDAVGYLQLRRLDNGKCVVKARVTPEHKVHNVAYRVTAEVEETGDGNFIESCICEDCAASQGGCKHISAFLAHLEILTNSKSTTETPCYWKRSNLSSAVQPGSCVRARDIGRGKPVEKGDIDFLEVYTRCGPSEGTMFEVLNPTPLLISVHEASVVFMQDASYPNKTASEFLRFMSSNISPSDCKNLEISTREQAKQSLWHEVRYGRISASTIYAIAHCKTEDGSLVQSLVGGYSVPDTAAMRRGRELEDAVIRLVMKKKKITKFSKCGIFIDSAHPAFGASPDGLTNEYVVEVKCPSTKASIKNFLKLDGSLQPKPYAQVQLQMKLANRKKALFGVATPTFETKEELHSVVEVPYDETHCCQLMEKALEFWTKAVYPKILGWNQ